MNVNSKYYQTQWDCFFKINNHFSKYSFEVGHPVCTIGFEHIPHNALELGVNRITISNSIKLEIFNPGLWKSSFIEFVQICAYKTCVSVNISLLSSSNYVETVA